MDSNRPNSHVSYLNIILEMMTGKITIFFRFVPHGVTMQLMQLEICSCFAYLSALNRIYACIMTCISNGMRRSL